MRPFCRSARPLISAAIAARKEKAGSGDSGTGQKDLVWDGDWGLTEALFKRGPGILSRSANLCYLWGYWLTLPTATVRPS